jgi:uncharacterized membrane protein
MERDLDTSPLQAPPEGSLHFDAHLSPHRSLGSKGFLIVMIVVGIISFAAGIVFTLMGAWPVLGFFGLDVAAVYFAFKWNYRSARAHETVQLSDDVLKIRKVDARGKATAWTCQPYWARVQYDEEAEEDVAIDITSHGRRLTVAAFLSPEERIQFGKALRLELEHHRTRGFVPMVAN